MGVQYWNLSYFLFHDGRISQLTSHLVRSSAYPCHLCHLAGPVWNPVLSSVCRRSVWSSGSASTSSVTWANSAFPCARPTVTSDFRRSAIEVPARISTANGTKQGMKCFQFPYTTSVATPTRPLRSIRRFPTMQVACQVACNTRG